MLEAFIDAHRSVFEVVGGGLLTLLIGVSAAVIAFKANQIANLQAALQERQTQIMERDVLPLLSFVVEWSPPKSASSATRARYPRIEISNLGAQVEEPKVTTQDYLQVSVWEPASWKEGVAIPCWLFETTLDTTHATGPFCYLRPMVQQSQSLQEGYAEWAMRTFGPFEEAGNYGSLLFGTLVAVCYQTQLGEHRCEQFWVDYEGAKRVTDGNPMRFIQKHGYYNLVLDPMTVERAALSQGADIYEGHTSLFSLEPSGFWNLVHTLTGVPIKGDLMKSAETSDPP